MISSPLMTEKPVKSPIIPPIQLSLSEVDIFASLVICKTDMSVNTIDPDLSYDVLIRLVEHRYLEYVFLSVNQKLFRGVQ